MYQRLGSKGKGEVSQWQIKNKGYQPFHSKERTEKSYKVRKEQVYKKVTGVESKEYKRCRSQI